MDKNVSFYTQDLADRDSARFLSPRTVEVHKARVMAKMGVERIPDHIGALISA